VIFSLILLWPHNVNGARSMPDHLPRSYQYTDALKSKGDTTIGNYELRFTVGSPFNFPGGGLIIRFSNPSSSYALDTSCAQVLVRADSSDASGFFVERFYRDDDGVSPWDEPDTESIGGFQIITQDTTATAVPTMTEWA